MRPVPAISFLLIAALRQGCGRDESTAPRLAADVTATPGRAPAHLTFTIQPPATFDANAVISPAIQVTFTGPSSDVVPAGGYVSLELVSLTPGATLSGTTRVKVVAGVATF